MLPRTQRLFKVRRQEANQLICGASSPLRVV